MESALFDILIIVILGTILYSVALALGMDPNAALAAAEPYAWALLPFALLYIGWKIYRYVRDRGELEPGDHVIYHKLKFSDHPGQRAEQVQPAAHGEGYSYIVRKPWTVVDTEDGETVEVVTPGGKHHVLEAGDPNLRRAGWLESLAMRVRWHKQFPSLDT
jgi:membrane protein implicated in regulation of membrane protease activity